jgi:hypothetical protein
VLTLAVDLVYVILFSHAVAFLTQRLGTRAAVNGFLLVSIYALVCITVYLVKRSPTLGSGEGFANATPLLAFQGAVFGMLFVYMTMETSGALAYLTGSEDAAGNAWVMWGTIGLIALAMVYPALLAIDVKPAAADWPWLRPAALIVLNGFLVLAISFWEVIFADTEPYSDITIGAKILIFAATYVFYLLFFAAPRFLLVALESNPLGTASFLASSGYFVWNSLSRIAW